MYLRVQKENTRVQRFDPGLVFWVLRGAEKLF